MAECLGDGVCTNPRCERHGVERATDGLRDALEKLHDRLYATGHQVGKAIALELDAILEAHPAGPAKHCHRCGYALREDDTYTRLDGTTYHLKGCPETLPAEPVGVSDEAVAKAEYAYEAFGATMRDALEAAAPLMGATPRPTREQIAEALHHNNHDLGGVACRKRWEGELTNCYERSMHNADAVLALMGGAGE